MAHRIIFPGFINSSLQVNDNVYAITAGGNVTTSDLVGKVISIDKESITVDETGAKTPTAGDFIMFHKDNEKNNSSLKGYYLETKFELPSQTEKRELFTIGSEITQSSK